MIKKNLNPNFKLLISILILILILIFSDKIIIKNLYSTSFNQVFYLNNYLSYLVTILCILLLINALNLIDGINGLASGFGGFWILGLSLLISSPDDGLLLLIFSIIIIFNTFLIYKGNYFLGDSGTLFLGSLVSFLTIHIYNDFNLQNIFISVEKIFIFFMIPGIDMFRLFLFRIINKKNPFKRDLDHLHHLMLKLFSLKLTLFLYFLVFIITNFLSYFSIISEIKIIIIYLIIYIFFVLYSKKKFKYPS